MIAAASVGARPLSTETIALKVMIGSQTSGITHHTVRVKSCRNSLQQEITN